MRLIYVAMVSACCGCATGAPKLSEAVHLGRQGLHAVTPALAALPAQKWAAELSEQEAVCSAQPLETEEERKECLGVPYERAQVVEDFTELYDRIAVLLRELEETARALEAL